MTFKAILDAWSEQLNPQMTHESYAVRLRVEDAARVHALAELYPGIDEERVITDLLSAALDQVEAAFPYVPGETVIREDDQGDPIYEDIGLTPGFLELVRKHQRALDKEPNNPDALIWLALFYSSAARDLRQSLCLGDSWKSIL